MHFKARRPSLALSTQYLVLTAAALTTSVGCAGKPLYPNSDEPSLTSQIAAVKAGESEQIHVQHAAIDDRELNQCAGLQNLRVLMLDHPEGRFSASGLQPLAALPALAHLRIRGQGIDDDALAQVARISSLQILNLPRGSFTDSGLESLKRLPKLEQLRFSSPRVTDVGINAVSEFPTLKRLHLIDIPLTDASLSQLAKMEQLESLYVDDIDFSDEAWQKLFEARKEMDRPLHVHVNEAHHDRDPHKH
jgi:hypothetical protein